VTEGHSTGKLSTIVVLRPRMLWRDRLRKYEIHIDGAVRARITNGGRVSIEVPAGRHVVAVRIAWTGSPDVVVDCPAAGSVSLSVEPTATLTTALEAALSTAVYLKLETV